MAKIKSYTDIEQSKVLAGILQPESADYCWGIDNETLHYNSSPYPCAWKDYTCKEYYIPCWSLAALFEVTSKAIVMNKMEGNGKYIFSSSYMGTYTTAQNPVDACVAMIEKLYKLNIL